MFCCMDTGQDPQTWTRAPSQIHYYIIRWLFWITTKLINSFIWAMITIYFYWFWYFSLINEISWPESFRNLLQPHRLALSFQEATTAWKRGCPTPTVVRTCIVCVCPYLKVIEESWENRRESEWEDLDSAGEEASMPKSGRNKKNRELWQCQKCT